MKNVRRLLFSALFTAFITTFFGCKKDAENPPVTVPDISTVSVSTITKTSAETIGNITSSGGAEVISRGVCWGTVHNPTIADSTITADLSGSPTFTANLTGLWPNTTYYVRAYATNSAGTAYGNEISFTTDQSSLATLTTFQVESITVARAVSGGNITDDAGELVTERGVCWGKAPNPTISDNKSIDGSGAGSFASYIWELHPSTKYYVRSYATNGSGTAYGNEYSFTTLAVSPIVFNPDLTYGSVSDIDGNTYKTIQIDTQLWMAENLKTTKLNDGTPVPDVTDNTEWSSLTTPGYSWHNNDEASYKDVYGALYNYYAVAAGDLCPTGWHVPTNAEWTTLISYLGGENVAGVKLAEKGATHWLTTATEATNETGFTGLPGGIRSVIGDYGLGFFVFEEGASWWSATESNALNAAIASLHWDDIIVTGQFTSNKIDGLSVRCVKDN